MNIPILGGLSGVAGDYDLFIVDLWGVVVLRGMLSPVDFEQQQNWKLQGV
ncbi:MAG: hypothetical protein HOF27_09550 [Rhodospirillaceae bacterium]|nr:hypothetical protein [Rhodospirillaceae bacterium]MBT3909906.1 hypothetical protein [Rhodospirillaceae bacterium]MBT5298658.1 hypothetical protein [Rhodospirillaceae bacterium]MBT7509997.1 hypothetical protein [Rhodospirillaceae bacterium]